MDLLPRSPNENEVSGVLSFLDQHLRRPGKRAGIVELDLRR